MRNKEENLELKVQNIGSDIPLPLSSDPNNKLEMETESFFPISVNQIDKIFESYMKGYKEEEIEELKAVGGPQGLIEKLKTDKVKGLQGNEEPDKYIRPYDEFHRIKQFLDNVKIEIPLQVSLFILKL